MKTQHDGDCTIYASLCNRTPESGICTCGYGLESLRQGNMNEIYSKEVVNMLELKSLLSESRPMTPEERKMTNEFFWSHFESSAKGEEKKGGG